MVESTRGRTLIGVGILAVTVAASPARAQQTRTEQVQEQRKAKAAALRPYERTRIEAVLFRIEDRYLVQRIFNPPRGVFARWGGFPEGGGIAGGPAYRYSTHAASFTATSAISARKYWEVDGTFAVPFASYKGLAQASARRHEYPQEDFFGLGSDSREVTRTNYLLRETSVDALGQVSPVSWLTVAGGAEFRSPRLGSGTDPSLPSTEQLFTEASAPGLSAQPDFVRLGTRATIDYTDQPIGPRAGGRYDISYDRYLDRDLDRYSFDRWNVDLRQYVPLVSTVRSIALRARWTSLTPEDGHEVPFYLQPTLGGGYSLRGLRPYRLRDRNLMFFQAEYRWDVNPFMTGAIFYDTGKVASSTGDLDFNDMHHDYGIGLRFGFLRAVALRAELAFGGGDGTRFVLKFNDAF
jgi:hypothetical protein